MKKIVILLFLSVPGTGQIKAQKDFIDSLVQGDQSIAEFFAMIDASVDTSWYTRVDNTHLQGRLFEIFEPNGEELFREFVSISGGKGLAYATLDLPKDSVMHYYHTTLKTLDFDSVTYEKRVTEWDEEAAVWFNYKTSTRETYSFYKNGAEISYISISWNEKWFRSWYHGVPARD